MNRSERGELRLSRVLFPNLADSLDAALAEHGPSTSAVTEFEAGLDSVVNERFAGAGFGALARTNGGARLTDAFKYAREVATWGVDAGLRLQIPEPEAFELAGVNLARMAELLAEHGNLTPVPAPYGLGPKGWSTLFESAARQLDGFYSAQNPLLIASEVGREFAALDDPSQTLASETLTAGVPQLGKPLKGAVLDGGITWTLRLIPATPAPPAIGLNFTNCGPHVTLPEMLMVQAMRAAAGQPPLDGGEGRGSFTWLAGKIGDGRLAARHVYDASDRAIRITAREIGSQGPHLGARSPVS